LVRFHTLEQEHFDIFAQYRLGEVDSILAQRPMATSLTRGIGTQLNHARNDLDALIVNTEIKDFIGERIN
jgi:hypothetical protein